MYISCPNCATHYNVSPDQLGPEGKSVRCTNCGNQWRQRQVASTPPPMQPQPAMQQAGQMPPGYGYPPPGYPPYPPYPPPGYPPQGQPPQGYPMPGAPESEQQTPPQPEPAPVDDTPLEPDPIEDDEADTLPEMDDPMESDTSDGNADDDDGLSSDDIEAMFGDEDEPEPVGSLFDEDEDDDEEEDEAPDDLDDLEEPEPIPQVFTAEDTGDDEYDDEDEDDEEEESRGSLVKIILAVVLALVIGIGAASIFLRDTVVDLIPGLEGLYSMIGLADDSLGAGLSINDVKSTRESIGGNDVLVVRGLLVNISDHDRPVPLLELKLSDLDGNVVQTAQTAPIKTQLDAGEQIGFKIEVEKPSALARRLEVTFVERPQTQAQ